MASEDLTPNQLCRLLAALELSKAFVVDAIRGRSIQKQDVKEIRSAVVGVHRVLNALDEAQPWETQ